MTADGNPSSGTDPTTPDPAVAAYAAAQAWATDWSQRWFLDATGGDRFRLGETDAGWVTHVEAYLILLAVAMEELGAATATRPSALRWLKGRGFDRGLRAAGLRRARGAGDPPPVAEIAVVVEIPTPSMLEPAALVAAEAGGACPVGVSDPRAIRRLAAHGITAHPIVIPWLEARATVRAAREPLAEAWRALIDDPPPMTCEGRDLTTQALRRLRPLVHRSMPHLAAERIAIERFLDAARPAAVAVASDQHRIGRLVVHVAQRRRIRSLVLQHGLPQARIGYLPVVADAVATWSPASRDWFVEHGADAARLPVTGNPRLDTLVASASGGEPSPHVLLALSSTAAETNLSLVRGTIQAVGRLPGGSLVIKLHPGQSDWSFVTALVREAGARAPVRILRHEPLYPLLAEAGVVVLHRSSVAVEALAARRPVIVYRGGPEPTAADLELVGLRLPVAASPDELAHLIREFATPHGADQYFWKRSDALAHIAGPLDGGSARRIVAWLRGGHGTERPA